jgi:uncharacterized iron-regulated protein
MHFVSNCARAFALLCFALATSCGAPRENAGGAALAGRIWDARAGEFVAAADMHRAVRFAKVVLLGETHDNPQHHRQQRELLAQIVATGRRPAVVMEQFDREFQAQLDAERVRAGRTADTVLDAGHFDRRSWEVEGYRPLVELALEFDLPIVAANLSRGDARLIVRDPARAALPAVDARVEHSLAADIEGSHCGEKIAPAVLAGMVAAQRARDVTMAQALVTQADRGAVLIAGIGHVRADRGAPLYLPRRQLVIGFVEVDSERRRPQDYFDGTFATAESFDYIWFTPRAPRADPCAAAPKLPSVPPRLGCATSATASGTRRATSVCRVLRGRARLPRTASRAGRRA